MNAFQDLHDVSLEDFKNNRDRLNAIKECQRLLTKLQTPFERVWEAVVDYPALTASIKLCLDIDLFDKWQEVGNDEQSCEGLVKITGFKQMDILRRVLRHLAAHAVLQAVDVDTYRPTRFSNALCKSVGAGIHYYYDISAKLYLHFPQYFRKLHDVTYQDPRRGLFQHVFDCEGDTVFDFYEASKHQRLSAKFNEWLAAYRLYRDPWTEIYPAEDMIAGYTTGPLLVDVGGNLGDDLELFRRNHPRYGRHLILQDLPGKVANAICSSEIQRMAHDFFTPQPTLARGARVYYLHSIIHDWEDREAGIILRHIKEAMVPGYSKLLINDIILPAREPSRRDTSIDVHMLAKLGGKERTDIMLRELIEQLGFKILRIWGSDSSETRIMEAELPFPSSTLSLPEQQGKIEAAPLKASSSLVEAKA